MVPLKKQGSKRTAGVERPAKAGRKKPAVRRFSVAQKLDLIRKYEACSQSMHQFCETHQVTTGSLCKWRKQYREGGVLGLESKSNPRNTGNRFRSWWEDAWQDDDFLMEE